MSRIERMRVGAASSWRRWPARWPVRLAGLAVIGVALWAVLWSIERPRARYDTLAYATLTYEAAGLAASDAWDRSLQLTLQYGNPGLVSKIHRDPSGAYFTGWDDPTRQRWIGIYRMRPVMPLLGAAAFPVLGTQAPVIAGVVAVVIVVLVAGFLLAPMGGALVAALFLLLTAANPLIAAWLPFLMPDGLGIALWFAALAALARYVLDGRGRWLLLGTGATLLLAFTRPSAVAIPLTMAICGAASLASRRGPWRRFALAAVVTAIPTLVFAAYAAALGLPSFSDLLQDLPTKHFSRPDVGNPFRFLIGQDLARLRDLPATIAEKPFAWLGLVGAAVGFALTRRWWTAPFVAAIATVPLLAGLHPVSTEVGRTFAPIYISLGVGVALLLAIAMRRARARFG